MLDTIGQTTIRTTIRPDPGSVLNERDLLIQQAERTREIRPVEKSEEGNKPKQDTRQQEETSKYKLEEHRIVFEKYNKNGELIFRIPPEQKPINELA